MKKEYLICIVIVIIVIVVAIVSSKGNTERSKNSSSEASGSLGNSEDRSYVMSNPYSGAKRQHPVLEYQRRASYDTHPANYGDPIRPPVGGIGSGPIYGNHFLGVPVPQGTMKLYSESDKYGARYPFYYQAKPLHPYDYFRPYGPNNQKLQDEIVIADTPFYMRNSSGYANAYGGNYKLTSNIPYGDIRVGGIDAATPFISSSNAYAPFQEVQSKWEKIGILTPSNGSSGILNLYRRPIAPLQNLFEYSVQDKDGFILPLKNVNYLEDGDIVSNVPGYGSVGTWKANIYVNNKWIWV